MTPQSAPRRRTSGQAGQGGTLSTEELSALKELLNTVEL